MIFDERRDLWGEAAVASDKIHDTISGTPGDGLEEGFRLSEETRRDLLLAIPLLQEALQIVKRVQEREDPIYTAYCQSREAKLSGALQ